ncbi:TniQ family protein [Paraburkholderia sediminicola]|uniref:TniQ family protein n=1 Tax=Paraburkholderia TaxID=1822464 RepID=UPI0038BDC7D9
MSTYPNFGSLPFRPKLQPDEWIETYLFRLARANGIRRPRLNDTKLLRPVLSVTSSSRPDGYPIWNDITLPRWSVVARSNKIRYCPECMIQSRYIRSRWRLRLFDICTIHDVRLKDDLAEPVMTRGYKSKGKHFITDVTDEQLWTGAVCPMPNERRHARQLWSSFERSIIERDIPRALEMLPYILLLDALLDAIAKNEWAGRLLPEIPRSANIAELVEQCQYAVRPNFHGVCTFLDHVTATDQRNIALQRLRRVLDDEAVRPTCLSSLPIAELRERLRRDGRDERGIRKHDLVRSRQASPDEYVSLEKARLLIGCSRQCLLDLIRNQFFPDTRAVQRGRLLFEYLPRSAVDACCKWYALHLTPEDVMKELKIDRRSYAVLLGTGMLHPFETDIPLFPRGDLHHIYRRMEDMSRPFPANAASMHPLFSAWMLGRGTNSATSIELAKEVFTGRFPVFRQPGRPGLSAYFVSEAALDRAHQLRKLEVARRRHRSVSAQQLSLLS